MRQIALITGAARNIGKGIAKSLIEAGYVCVLVDIDSEQLKQTVVELNGAEHCLEYVADISDIKQIDQMCRWLEDKDILLTTLVNNAAYESSVSIKSITSSELIKSFQTNLEGPFYLTSLVLNNWLKSGIKGNIIFTSSVHSQLTRTHALYSASKAAIEMFVKEAALEFGEYGIRINAVAPGPTQDTLELKHDYRVPLGFYQQPQDIGEAVKFLISGKARFITGQSLKIDGGYSLPHVHHWMSKGKLPDSTKQ